MPTNHNKEDDMMKKTTFWIAVAGFLGVVFTNLYNPILAKTFVTRQEFNELKMEINQKLEKIDSKIDRTDSKIEKILVLMIDRSRV
jgi:peptidoglycan hydrolase CwlO-like protein